VTSEPVASPQSTRAIILGAQVWPDFPDLPASEVFLHSAADLQAYLKDPHGMGLPSKNVLDLFDNAGSADEIDKRISSFLSDPTLPGAPKLTDVLVYYVGHGEAVLNKDLYLAIRRTRTENVALSSIPVSALRTTLENAAGHTRRLIIIDCCFAAAAFTAFQEVFGPPPKSVMGKNVPSKAVSLFCSSSAADPSFYTGNRYTMFTEALLQVLRSGSVTQENLLTTRELKDELNALLTTRYQTKAPRAEVYPADSREGDLADVPYFKVLRPSGRRLPKNSPSPDPALPDSLSCFLVVSETEELANGGTKLTNHVNEALKTNRQEIAEAAGRKEDAGKCNRSFASTCVSSVSEFEAAVRWLCRADIAVFDLTGYEPAVMLLLGVRAVVRRGITICTVRSKPDDEATDASPFNLQDINVLYYWDEQVGGEQDPRDIIAQRCIQAFREMRQQPRYLDLPAYDAVRMVPPDPEGGRALTYRERVLMLCPFDPEYQSRNWKKHLHRDLPVEIKARLGLKKKPDMVRTLDLISPRIVSQSLFECIRLTELCLIDWTGWRPNVFFEMGVRLACSPIGPVLLIEQSHAAPETVNLEVTLGGTNDMIPQNMEQFAGLMRLFQPIPYACDDGGTTDGKEEKSVYTAVLELHESLREDLPTRTTPDQVSPNATFKLISEWIDHRIDISARPIYTELSVAADLLSSPDPEAAGRSQVLYPRNQRLSAQSQAGARERRLAAWFYIDQRFTPQEIASKPDLLTMYRQLGALACNALIASESSSDREAAKQIRARIDKLNANP
jgi:hypothetical protein